MSQKCILVTGGAGFIGSHLCERLVKDGHRVISLDNYFTGSRENHVPGVEYREGHTKDIAKYVTEDPDIIYHLGEYSRVAPSLAEPGLVWDLNIEGTLGVLEFWRGKTCKLVYAGSSTRFAEPRADAVDGKDRAPYSWGKASMTDLIHNYGRWYALPYSIAYFYNVYGPGERAGQFDGGYGTVVGTFLEHARRKEVCIIHGTGEQTRAFTHVDDTVEGLILIGEKGLSDEYAIAAAEVYSLLDVARFLGLSATFVPATPTTRSSGTDDTSKLRALGWVQRHTLPDYLATAL